MSATTIVKSTDQQNFLAHVTNDVLGCGVPRYGPPNDAAKVSDAKICVFISST
jgi:hypothetical protein